MMKPAFNRMLNGLVLATGALAVAGALASASSAELPKATQAILKEVKMGPEILSGLDKELVMKPEWIEGAKKEGGFSIVGTWDVRQFQKLEAPFLERYPYIHIKYARATRYDRAIKPLLAFETGRVINDVITGVGAKLNAFKKAGAPVRLDGLPNWKNVPKGMKGDDGFWVGQRLRYWCTAYNTSKVDKKDLPRTWDDLLTNPRWRNGAIGMGNRPNLWLLPLWDIKGEQGVRDYIDRLFNVVKPQLRKEGMNALLSLVAAGEFDMSLTSAAYRTQQMVDRGAPIGWHCPEPVPLAVSEMIVMKGGHVNSSFMFVNWFLSKEGQLSQFAANKAPPVHKDMQTKQFLSFADEIVGKPLAYRDPASIEEDLPKLFKIWNPVWQKGRGIEYKTVKVKLGDVLRKGRRIVFPAESGKHTVKISGSRTKVKINGKKAGRGMLKAGMTCEVTYPGHDHDEAKSVSCSK